MQSTAEAPKKKPGQPQPAQKPVELAPNPFAQEQTKPLAQPPPAQTNPFAQKPAPKESKMGDVPKKLDLPAPKEKTDAPPPLLAKTEGKQEPGSATITPKREKTRTEIAYERLRKRQEEEREGGSARPTYHRENPGNRPRGLTEEEKEEREGNRTYLDRMARLGSVAGRRAVPQEEGNPQAQKKKKPAETEEETKL